MIKRYLELKSIAKAAEAEMDAIKKEWIDTLPLGESSIDGHTVSIVKRTRIDLDKEAVLMAVGADAYRSLEKISEFVVVIVK
jgi:hypothetical protein